MSADRNSVWHEGELQVRERAGFGALSGSGIHSTLPQGAAHFLRQQRLAAFASVDEQGRTWASLRIGEPGFLEAPNLSTVETAPLGLEGDPLLKNLKSNPAVGLVVIDLANRRRMRVNGAADVLPDGRLRIRTRQVYGNCPQYIQERVEKPESAPQKAGHMVSESEELSEEQRRWVGGADTFFIATAHPESGADASHRGGNPGFVHVGSAGRLVIPDYSGNKMFNTLGNIAVNPRVGLAFPDFERGRSLQLSGQARIIWDFDAAKFPGAERLLEFDVEKAVELDYSALRGYRFQSYSPFNPPLAAKDQ